MTVLIVLVFNLIICLVNLVILWQLFKLKSYLVKINQNLLSIEVEDIILLKKISLEIFLTALQIQKSKNNYRKLRKNINKISKIIIVSRYIYKIYLRRMDETSLNLK
jgi:hypothetical protein